MTSSQPSSSDFNKRSIKYWLFDAAILFSLVSTIAWTSRTILGKHSIEQQQHQLQNSHRRLEDSFHVGEIVEIYEPSLHQDTFASFAFAAQITNVHYSDDANQDEDSPIIASYDVLPGFGVETLFQLSPSSIRPMRHYEYNTKAMCDFGTVTHNEDKNNEREYHQHLISCTVLSFFPESSNAGNGGWYSVSYQDETEDGVVKFTKRPLSKILRIVEAETTEEEPAPSFHASPSSVPSNIEPEFEVGALVETYNSEHSPFAFPATVSSISYSSLDNTFKYTLIHGITTTIMENVDADMIHPFEAAEEGTESLCNVGSTGSIYMVPCTIVSHSDDEASYQVTLKESSSLRNSRRDESMSLPYLNVQRIISREGAAR